MKLSHFASAAASVLVLAVAAPAFAQTGYINGFYGENRDHPARHNTEEYGANGAVSVPMGMLEFSGEISYLDTGRDTLGSGTATPTVTSFTPDTQTLGAASVYVRGDKMSYGVTVAGGSMGDLAVYRANAAGAPGATIDINSVSELEGSAFVEGYFDKWVGSARVSYGSMDLGDMVQSLFVRGKRPTTTTVYHDQGVTKNYLDVGIAGSFFFTDNARLIIASQYKDMEHDDPVISSSLGVEWRKKDSPIGIRTDADFSKYGSSLTVGVVGSFGAGNLNDRVRKGPASPWTSTLRNFDTQFVKGNF